MTGGRRRAGSGGETVVVGAVPSRIRGHVAGTDAGRVPTKRFCPLLGDFRLFGGGGEKFPLRKCVSSAACSAGREPRVGFRSEWENHEDEIKRQRDEWVLPPPGASEAKLGAGDVGGRGPAGCQQPPASDPGKAPPNRGTALAEPMGGGAVRPRGREEEGSSVARPGRPLEITPLKPSEERREWRGKAGNISISEEVTCDPEGGSIVPLLRGTQTLGSLSA